MDRVLEWERPYAKWFVGGELNASVNCVDRHVAAGRGDKVAIQFEGEPGDSRTITYAELQDEVSQAANALLELGIVKGDRVAIYLPMIPEAVISMLACARIGAAHSVIFGGFSSQAIFDRVVDADAKLVITADGGWRRGNGGLAQAGRRRGAGQGRDVASSTCWSSSAAATTSTGPTDATCGGTTSSASSRARTTPRPTTPSSPCSSSTRREPPGNPRESCTRPAAT